MVGRGAFLLSTFSSLLLYCGYAAVEAAGIEPASRNVSMPASTCVVGSLISLANSPTDRVFRKLAGNGF